MDKKKFICFHGHFYQPPRENPWIEDVEIQSSAYPYHDWNERITAECYAPNASSRILNESFQVFKIVNNYKKISFNFGPTLLDWMQKNSSDTYEAIIESDKKSMQEFDGHGSAMAQAYNHIIMPLADEQDKITQIVLVIKEFKFRYGREPLGMWLPETAVNTKTLEIMADFNIQFTVLSPYQAHSYCNTHEKDAKWIETKDNTIDPRRPYFILLPSGKKINVFFYDGSLSNAIAFQGLLKDGKNFADKLLSSFDSNSEDPQIVHVATDGETYGHHHQHGDMALAYATFYIENNSDVEITNYAKFLSEFPPQYEAKIHENTAWSCAHGIERWRSDCGCHTGGGHDWNQEWRKPLREALDWLRDKIKEKFIQETTHYLNNPWEARNNYVDIILDRSKKTKDLFFHEFAKNPSNHEERCKILKWLETLRHAMLMYTSCGWFFSDISGIETQQCLQYAARVIQLAKNLFNFSESDEENFLNILSKAKSNIPLHKNGRYIYENYVKTSIADHKLIAANNIVSLLLSPEERKQVEKSYSHDFIINQSEQYKSGKAKIIVGNCQLNSKITESSFSFLFSVLHFGDHNILAGVKYFTSNEDYEKIKNDIMNSFSSSDLPAIIRIIDKKFKDSTFSLQSLFKDKQTHILRSVLRNTRYELYGIHRNILENHYALIVYLTKLGQPIHRYLKSSAEVVTNYQLRLEFRKENLDLKNIKNQVNNATKWQLELDSARLRLLFQERLLKYFKTFLSNPHSIQELKNLEKLISFAKKCPFNPDMWKLQNLYYEENKKYLANSSSDEFKKIWKQLGNTLDFASEI